MVGTIDTSTAYEVIHYLRRDRGETPSTWASEGAFNTTILLIDTPHLYIAANPTPPGYPIGPYDILLKSLGNLISADHPSEDLTEKAAVLTERWAVANYATLLADRDSMKRSASTLEYTKVPVGLWIDHVHRSGGMFDQRFKGLIASVMQITENQIDVLHELSQDDAKVRDAYASLETSEVGKLMADAFVVSWLLRGRLHSELARLQGRQIVQHPRRDAVQPGACRVLPYQVTDVTLHLAAVALNLAMTEEKLEDRIQSWARMVIWARGAIASEKIDVSPSGGAKEAFASAVEAVRHYQSERNLGVIRKAARQMGAIGVADKTVALAEWLEQESSDLEDGSHFRLEDWQPTPATEPFPLKDLVAGPSGRVRPIWKVFGSFSKP
jgi:hypothetical protein